MPPPAMGQRTLPIWRRNLSRRIIDMPLGQNVTMQDTLIKRTTAKTNKESIRSKKTNTTITSKIGLPSSDPAKDTFGTRKMSFFIKEDLLRRLYNFAYWDRHSVTEAVNTVLEDGLKGKITKNKA
jgi:hypothetical protein